MSKSQDFAYKAFISYSHAADGLLAPKLQSGLHQFAKPWYRLRAMRIFRDETSLSNSPQLWPPIEEALSQSEYFLLLASPDAARSFWVKKEIEYWLQNCCPEKLLIILTGGELQWNSSIKGFDWAVTTAMPRDINYFFCNEPRYTDFREIKSTEQLSVRNPVFRAAVADVASTLLGRDKDELIGEDIRLHRQTRRIASSGVFVLLLLTVTSIIAAVIAVQNQREAQLRQRIAESQRLASQAMEELNGPNFELAMLLAIEAGLRAETTDAFDALHAVLAFPGRTETVLPGHSDITSKIALSPSEDRVLATSDDASIVRVWDVAEGEELVQLVGHTSPVRVALWNGDGTRILTTGGVTARAWDAMTGKELFALTGHTNNLIDAAWNTDGTLILTHGRDQSARIWDAETGKELVVLTGHTDDIQKATWHPSANLVLTTSWDRTVRVWNAETGEEIMFLSLPDVRLREAEWSPTGNHIVVAGDGLYLWNLQKKDYFQTLTEQDNRVESVRWSHDEKWIATSDGEKVVSVWDINQGKRISVLEHLFHGVRRIQWSPDNTRIATSIGGIISIWDARSGKEQVRIDEHTKSNSDKTSVIFMRWNQDGTRILTASADDTVRIWDAFSGDELINLATYSGLDEGSIGDIDGVIWTKDERRVVTSGHTDGSVRIWRIDAGGEIPPIPTGTSFARYVAWNPDESYFLVHSDGGRYEPGSVQVLNSNNGERVSTLAVPGYLKFARWTDQNNEIIILSNPSQLEYDISQINLDGTIPEIEGSKVQLWDSQSNDISKLIIDERIDNIDWIDNLGKVVTASDLSVQIWNMGTETPHAIYKGHTENITDVSLDRAGSRLLTASEDRSVHILDVQSGEDTVPPLMHSHAVGMAEWNESETQILTTCYLWADDDCTDAYVWDITSEQEPILLFTLDDHRGKIESAKWNTDGTRILTTSQDATAIVWDADTGQILLTLVGHSDRVKDAIWNRDESQILTRGVNGNARVWDAETGQELFVLSGHRSWVEQAVWSHDESQILTVGWEGTARLWDAKTGTELIAFEQPHDKTFVIEHAVLNKQGTRLLAAGRDGLVRQYFTDMKTLLDSACEQLPRNMTFIEWRRFMISEPYRVSCKGLGLFPTPVELLAQNLARNGQIEEAINQFERAKLLFPHITFNPAQEANKYAAESLIKEAKQIALESGDITNAITKFQSALALDNRYKFDPETEAKRYTARWLLDQGYAAVDNQKDVEEAISFFEKAMIFDPTLQFDAALEAKRLAALD